MKFYAIELPEKVEGVWRRPIIPLVDPPKEKPSIQKMEGDSGNLLIKAYPSGLITVEMVPSNPIDLMRVGRMYLGGPNHEAIQGLLGLMLNKHLAQVAINDGADPAYWVAQQHPYGNDNPYVIWGVQMTIVKGLLTYTGELTGECSKRCGHTVKLPKMEPETLPSCQKCDGTLIFEIPA